MNNVRVIFHIDMNAFFASCEEIKRPYIKDKPFAVGARYSKKGVLSTSNYIARKYGVYSAMSVSDALKKCPNLIILDSDYQFYIECSKKFLKIIYEYTDRVEQASIDEAFIDVTDIDMHPVEFAKLLQKRIKDECQLPSSIGIAPTLFLAKMASDMKKPMGITIVRKRDIKDKIFPLDVSDMFGIGKKTSPKLKELGIKTIGDLYERLDELKDFFGDKMYEYIKSTLEGRSSDVVDPDRYSSFSSIGNSRTSIQPITSEEEAYEFLNYVGEITYNRLKKYNLKAYTFTIQIKYTYLKTYSKSKTYNDSTNDRLEFFDRCKELFDSLWNGSDIRLIGVQTSNLEEIGMKVYDLFHLDNIEDEEKLNKALNSIEEKYGKNAIKKGIK
ncbi:MAG: DNA polymerase IV [Acholeplasmatales bacterium]|nr:DNA polymerase IV [Acholeplasmatales bacterium]